MTLAIATIFALAIATSGLAGAAKATPDQYIGTWIGTWPHGKSTIEFHVDDIDADSKVYGTYCWVRNVHPWDRRWYDIHPVEGIDVELKRDKIRWRFGNVRWAFSVQGNQGTRLRMEFWRDGNKEQLELIRESVEDSDCLSRLTKLPGPDAAGLAAKTEMAYPDKKGDRIVRPVSGFSTRYGNDLPMTIYLPKRGSGPFPVVVYNHGRPFKSIQSADYKLSRRFPLVKRLTAAGFAVALPVRSGYAPSSGHDRERISCNHPARSQFTSAIKAARADITAAVSRVKELREIDPERVFVGGTSAGGFAAGDAMASLEGKAKGIFVLNGGRCGKRGPLFRGHRFAVDIFRKAASNSSIPIVFFASENDAVIPPPSTLGLYQATCEARGSRCKGSVFLVNVSDAGHGQWNTTERASDSLISFVTRVEP